MQFETLAFERGELFRRAALVETAIRTADLCSAPFHNLRQGQHPRSADADEEKGAGEKIVRAGEVAHFARAMQL